METDGPYLAPEPYRGNVAHPGMIPLIAEQIAKIKAVSLDSVYEQTRKNTKAMYGI